MSVYQWPPRQRSSSRSSLTINSPTPTRPTTTFNPSTPLRPATTPPSRPPRRIPSFGAAFIHTTPPPRSPAQLRAMLDPSTVGPTRMPSYVGSLLDAFTIDNIGETSLDLDRSFEVSPRREPQALLLEDPSATTTISEETHSRMSSPEPGPAAAPAVRFEGLQLTLSLPERPFSMGSMSELPTRTPSPPPSRPHTPTPVGRHGIRLDSAAFEKPPQAFAITTESPPTRPRRRSCILNCVRKSVKRAVRKGN